MAAMAFELPPAGRDLLASQSGVVACWQAEQLGLDARALKERLRYGDWQRLHHGVYATFTGRPDREAQLWGALLRAGPTAVLSHHTAAERHGLLGRPSAAIHVTVPSCQNPARRQKIHGVVIHRSDAILARRHPAMSPPCTRVEETVLDLIKVAASPDEAYDWICKAVGQRRTTAKRIRAALNAREKFPMRRETEVALDDAGEGMLSWLERRYVRGVERPHGLPAARRQARVRYGNGSRYLDNLYEDYQLCVELDGAAAHPADKRWRDIRRDRANLATTQTVTMRVGFLDLVDQGRRCGTAAEIAAVLTANARGSGRGHAVGHRCAAPACPVAAHILLGVSSRGIFPRDDTRTTPCAEPGRYSGMFLCAPRRAGAAAIAAAMAAAVAAGEMISSMTPISTARSRPATVAACSAASACSASCSWSAGTVASFRLCRMRTAATAPMTATSASGQA